MKKRLISTLLALCMTLALLPGTALAADDIIASGECGAQGNNVTWVLDNNGLLTISGQGEMADFGPLYISMDMYAPWKDNQTKITAVKVEQGVTSIGTCAFYRCSNMCNIDIPDSMKNIGKDAFRDCAKLESVRIPDSVTSVEDHAFVNCTSLVNVEISKNLPSIEFGVFTNCTSIKEITIPTGVLRIGDYAFSGCVSLTNITIPENVTSIGDCAFWGCQSLSSIVLPDGLITIGPTAFYSCSALTQINIPDSVTTIGPDAFWSCDSLTTVTIPSSVNSFGLSAFRDCDELTSVNIQEGVTEIGPWAFDHCDKLSTVNIPSSVTTIGNGAFSICDSLTSIMIPSGVEKIGDTPFYFCTNLAEIKVADDNLVYTDVDGVLFTKDLSTLVAYPIGNTRTTYTIPNGVKTISPGAFIHCTNLASIGVPASLTTVDWDATSECYNLKDVYYAGTNEQWKKIHFLDHPTGDHLTTDVLRSAKIHYANEQCIITYSANGGIGTMSDETVGVGEVYSLPACGFTAPSGKEFKAWQIGNEEYNPNDIYTVTSDTAIIALWREIPTTRYSLTGTVTGHQGITYTVVSAKLVGLDGVVYPASVGDGVLDQQTGKTAYPYNVSAPVGQYELVVEATTDQGITVNRTALVKLSNGNEVKDVNLPNGQAKSKVTTNKSGTTAIVGGLDDLIVASDLENGASVEIDLTINDVNGSVPGVTEIQGAASGQTLELMEISITKTVNDVVTTITDAGSATIEIVLPFESDGKSNIKVYRYHDNGVEALTERASSVGEKIEISNNSITIHAKKFSVYAIGYTDTENPTDKPVTPPPDNIGSSSGRDDSDRDSGYSISVSTRITGGTIKVRPTSAEKGDTVTITVTPKAGYKLDKLTVTDSKGNEVKLTDKGDGTFTFVMPGAKVTVNAAFVPAAPAVSFSDVQAGAYYYDAVAWAVEQGITAGTTATTFSPNSPCTRAQIVTFLWRAAGSPRASANSSFTDVAAGSYYYDAVAWAVANGITSGTSATTFSPNATCTRTQAVTFLYRSAGSPAAGGESSFTDVAGDAYYTNAVQWAVGKGVTAGTSATTFSPNDNCTRAQIVTFLYRDRAN